MALGGEREFTDFFTENLGGEKNYAHYTHCQTDYIYALYSDAWDYEHANTTHELSKAFHK